MQTILAGQVNDEMLETMQKALMVFFGKTVRIVIEESDGEKKRRGK